MISSALLGLSVAIAVQAAEASGTDWLEAENYESQHGSTSATFIMPSASGGACVANNWGAKTGHFLRYRTELESDFAALYVTLRYARETAGDAVVSVTVDGDATSTAIIKLPSTGNWGFTPEGWHYAAVKLPAVAKGAHVIEIGSRADANNVNFDGLYLSVEPLDTHRAVVEPPSGPDLIAPLGEGLVPLPCKTPVALPYSRRKAYVAGNGLVQTLLSTPQPGGMGGNIAGPGLHVKLAGHGPWTSVGQTLVNSPVPTVVTRLEWSLVDMVQEVFAAAPEEQGFFMRVTVTNRTGTSQAYELASLVCNAGAAAVADGTRLVAKGQTLLHVFPTPSILVSASERNLPGPLGGNPALRIRVQVEAYTSTSFDLQLVGDGLSRDKAHGAAVQVWRDKLAPAVPVKLPDPQLQYAFDASVRQILTLIESRPDHARVLKGLEHYYGANPYDTFQVSRALDAIGLKADAEELLRHQIAHLKEDGFFEMWESGDLAKDGTDQWIVQGLAAAALWNHYELWRDDAWLREIAPALVKSAQATLRLRQSHADVAKQGDVEVEGWLPPIFGDGGLGRGYHWSQNAGPLSGVRIAADVARMLKLPEAAELQAGYLDFQCAFDTVRTRAALADPERMLSAFPGATGDERTRPLWGVVMSVSAFDAISPDDRAALKTLRFMQGNRHSALHLNLGYSRGVWPYLSAEVALWHLRLGETAEAWRILRAMVDRASSTVCWYEEIDVQPPLGHGDPADVWAAAEMVYLARQLAVPLQSPFRSSRSVPERLDRIVLTAARGASNARPVGSQADRLTSKAQCSGSRRQPQRCHTVVTRGIAGRGLQREFDRSLLRFGTIEQSNEQLVRARTQIGGQ
jgi:hypothetical protein